MVTVSNSVGAIGLPGLGMSVRPKIPITHFSLIALRALLPDPREDANTLNLAAGAEFLEVIARWFVEACERLLQQGLARDYRNVTERSVILRGRIEIRPTVMSWLRGDAAATVTHDEFDVDSPINRVLKAALSALADAEGVADETRVKGRRLVRQMAAVGSLRSPDLHVRPTRGQARYGVPLDLARQILSAMARELEGGSLRSQTFLFSTPILIESGIREILRRRLNPLIVKKGGRTLSPSTVTVNPDLELGPRPFTGDIKYKISRTGWNRPDLAQAVFFAAAYRSPFAIVVGFRDENSAPPDLLRVGDISVAMATWNASVNLTPLEAEERLVVDVAQLLEGAGFAA